MTMFFFWCKPKTVDAALAPLAKIQENLEDVSATRATDAESKRLQAKGLLASARADDDQQIQADVILSKLTKLLTVEPEDLEAFNTVTEE
jgi:hypothetical protein